MPQSTPVFYFPERSAMAYTTVASVRARLPLITTEVQSDALITDYIAQADAEVDARLRAVYAVPFPNPDSLVRYISLELACATTLENVYGSSVPEGAEVPVRMQERAKTLLDGIAAGSILLAGVTQRSTSGPAVHTEGLTRDAEGKSEFWVDPEVSRRRGDE
jgi:hypothetical protein